MNRRDRETVIDTGVFYVGLGDRFDDDRRLVRTKSTANTVPAPRESSPAHKRELDGGGGKKDGGDVVFGRENQEVKS
ncbi:MAG: hypothetical protein ACREHE_17055 [Rhizomicrobium sp.]